MTTTEVHDSARPGVPSSAPDDPLVEAPVDAPVDALIDPPAGDLFVCPELADLIENFTTDGVDPGADEEPHDVFASYTPPNSIRVTFRPVDQ
jgi:hypothetical protein